MCCFDWVCACVFIPESYLYIGLFEYVSDFPDVWECEGKGGPFFIPLRLCECGGVGGGFESFSVSCDVLAYGSGRWGTGCFWICVG